jgi:hypothetical protein
MDRLKMIGQAFAEKDALKERHLSPYKRTRRFYFIHNINTIYYIILK